MNVQYPQYPYPSHATPVPLPPLSGNSVILGMGLPMGFGMLGSSLVAALLPGAEHDLHIAWSLVLMDLAALGPLAFFAFVTGRQRLGFGALASLGPSIVLALVAMIVLALLR
jgi:hypothetical protein